MSRLTVRQSVLLALGALCGTCSLACSSYNGGSSNSDASEVAVGREAIIYGTDDRVDLESYPDAKIRDLGLRLVGALISREYVQSLPDGSYALNGPTLGQRLDLCPEEPDLDEPSLSHCTAVLAENNTAITAGHCVDEQTKGDSVFVQGYLAGVTLGPVDADRVHSIVRVLSWHNGDIDSDSGNDFAIVELDSADKLPALAFAAPPPLIETGEAVVVVGTSEGLPVRAEAGGKVYDASPADYFEVSSDTFQGGSGSAVFTASGEYAGVLVGGSPDYTWDDERKCSLRRRLDAPAERGELVVRATVIEAALESALRDAGEKPACSLRPARGNPRGVAFGAGLIFLAGGWRRSRRRRWDVDDSKVSASWFVRGSRLRTCPDR